MLNCIFPQIFHKWSKWTVVEEGTIVTSTRYKGVTVPNSERSTGKYIDQTRRCEVCGFKQRQRSTTEI